MPWAIAQNDIEMAYNYLGLGFLEWNNHDKCVQDGCYEFTNKFVYKERGVYPISETSLSKLVHHKNMTLSFHKGL